MSTRHSSEDPRIGGIRPENVRYERPSSALFSSAPYRENKQSFTNSGRGSILWTAYL